MTSPAVKLANALGDVDAMDALMHDDVSMQLPASALQYAGPHRGRAAVLAFNSENFGERYFPDVEVDVLTELEAGDLSAVRFRFRARLRRTGETYDGEYAFFVRSSEGRIIEIFEFIDTLAVGLFMGTAVRTSG